MPSTQLVSSSLGAAALARQLAPLLLLPPRYHRAALDAMPPAIRQRVESTPREALPPPLKELLLPWGQAAQALNAGADIPLLSAAAGPDTLFVEADEPPPTALLPRPPRGWLAQALAPEILIVTAAASLILTRIRTLAALGSAAAAAAVVPAKDLAIYSAQAAATAAAAGRAGVAAAAAGAANHTSATGRAAVAYLALLPPAVGAPLTAIQHTAARARCAVMRVPGGGLVLRCWSAACAVPFALAGAALSVLDAAAATRHWVVVTAAWGVASLATAAQQALALLRVWANALFRRAASVPAGAVSAFRAEATTPPSRPTGADSRWWLSLPPRFQLSAALSTPRTVLLNVYAAWQARCAAAYAAANAAAAQAAALPSTAAHSAAELAHTAAGLARSPLATARRLLCSVRAEASAKWAATSAAVSAAPGAVSSVVVGVPVAAVAWGKRVTGQSTECLTSPSRQEVNRAEAMPTRQTDAPVWVQERRALARGERVSGKNGAAHPPPSPARFPRAQQVSSARSASEMAGRAARLAVSACLGAVPSWASKGGQAPVAACESPITAGKSPVAVGGC
jgi:hypothetical protein